MKDWYLRQTSRDRMIVLFVGGLCLLTGLYAFVWYPLNDGMQQRRLGVENRKDDLQFMHDSAAKLAAIGGTSGGEVLKTNQAPYLLMAQLINSHKLNKAKSIEPTKKGGVRVDFDKVEFDKLVAMLAELERYGLTMESINLNGRSKETGFVSARLTMEKG